LKAYFNNKAKYEQDAPLNDDDVLAAFYNIVASIETPKNVWIEHDGLSKPCLVSDWFGAVEFRDGERRLAGLSRLPSYMWIHTEEPETMASGSIEKRRKWNNQI